MSKITKKELKKQLDGVQNRFAALVKDLKASGYICESVYAPFAHDYQEEQSDYDALITILDSKEPQLKQLDQSDDTAKELLEVDLSSELTGSELCRAMLARGDTRIMCIVSDEGTRQDLTHVIRAYSDGKFHTKANRWSYAVPINNQGEPLTAAEVGL